MTEISATRMRSNHMSLTVGGKVFSVVGVVLFLLVCVSGSAIWQMSKLGAELEAIAERDLPIAEALAELTIHQLEQAVHYERGLRLAQALASQPDEQKHFDETMVVFNDLSKKVDKEIASLIPFIGQAKQKAGSANEATLLANVEQSLAALVTEHKDYHKHATDAIEKVLARDQTGLKSLLAIVEEEEEHLDHALEELLLKVSKFTTHAALEAEHHEIFALNLIISVSVFAFVVGIALTFIIVKRSIVKPLKEVVGGLTALTGGNYDVDVSVQSNDEIGEVAEAYETFKDAMIIAEKAKAEQAKLKREADQAQKAKMAEIANGFEQTVGEIVLSVSHASTELETTASSMSSISEKANTEASSVAHASEEVSSNVNAVASSAEEMSASIAEVDQRIASASSISQSAVTQVDTTSQEIEALNKAAEEISEFISIISDIAEQTNLLALNATIESARAGEAGKGFAVVAGEVKALAGQSAKATEEITKKVQDILERCKQSSNSMTTVTQSIEELNITSLSIKDDMHQIRAATDEISQNISNVSHMMLEVTENVSGVNVASQEAGSAAAQVTVSAGELNEQSSRLASEVETFISDLRSEPVDQQANAGDKLVA